MNKTLFEYHRVSGPRLALQLSRLIDSFPVVITALTSLLYLNPSLGRSQGSQYTSDVHQVKLSDHHQSNEVDPDTFNYPYGVFPRDNDLFNFVPCSALPMHSLPDLDNPDPKGTWGRTGYTDDPSMWAWGKRTGNWSAYDCTDGTRGISLCGFLDVPLDYTNESDTRIARLAITKYQVSGIPPAECSQEQTAGKPSERTIVYNPGGPGGSGATSALTGGQDYSERLSNHTFDFLGFDPRGVNGSLPSISCYPYNADRDRWSQLTDQARVEFPEPRTQLLLTDAMNDAIFNACFQRYGDVGRFMTTAFVARDVEEIRKALGEDKLTAHMVSYGTGIGQTYASMFPDSVGRMILDGTEYVKDHRLTGGFGWTALDNGTNAWYDGFLGECVKAGPEHCALAKNYTSEEVTLENLNGRMENLFKSLIQHPRPAYTQTSGPSLITYNRLVAMAYSSMYSPATWPAFASMLYELEQNNTTAIAQDLDSRWEWDPSSPSLPNRKLGSDELFIMVVCSDSYDAPQPSLDWWETLWANMTEKSWIAGDSRFSDVFPCKQFDKYWPQPAEVYRGPLNKTLSNPVLLIAETYDPATPLRNGRRLLTEMGDNAKLIVHHGYGHSSGRDLSNCTDSIIREYMMNGTLDQTKFKNGETDCYANGKPYLAAPTRSVAGTWRQQIEELRITNPRLVRGL